tara:strand:- start:413 stop:847 length:435 start_codon:yes stop_codon:yes gene_type:complete
MFINVKNLKKKKLLTYSIGLIILLIILYQISFFKKVYFLITRDYDSRLYNTYEYCGQESVGYLINLKKKFNINYKIPIINYGNSPNSSWYFYDLKIKETNRVIFLNYSMGNENFNYELNDEHSHNLNDYNILDNYENCYLLEKK